MDKVNKGKRCGYYDGTRDWEGESRRLEIIGANHGWDLGMIIPELVKVRVRRRVRVRVVRVSGRGEE